MDLEPQTQLRYRISIRITLAERRQLDAAAESHGLTLSGYVRARLLAVMPGARSRRPRVDTVLLARVLVRLGMAASALADIARAAGAELTLMPGVERDLARELRAIRQCRSQLMQALRRKAEPT